MQIGDRTQAILLDIDDKMNAIRHRICQGTTYEQYRSWCGELRGLEQAREIIMPPKEAKTKVAA